MLRGAARSVSTYSVPARSRYVVEQPRVGPRRVLHEEGQLRPVRRRRRHRHRWRGRARSGRERGRHEHLGDRLVAERVELGPPVAQVATPHPLVMAPRSSRRARRRAARRTCTPGPVPWACSRHHRRRTPSSPSELAPPFAQEVGERLGLLAPPPCASHGPRARVGTLGPDEINRWPRLARQRLAGPGWSLAMPVTTGSRTWPTTSARPTCGTRSRRGPSRRSASSSTRSASSPGMRVLDVGCGPGRHAHALGRRGIAVHGVDISRALRRPRPERRARRA